MRDERGRDNLPQISHFLCSPIENPRNIYPAAFVLCLPFVRFPCAKGLRSDLDLLAGQKKGQDLRANSPHSGLHGGFERRRGYKKENCLIEVNGAPFPPSNLK